MIERRNAETRPSSPRSSSFSSITARYSCSSSRVLTGARGDLLVLLDGDAEAAVGVGLGGAEHGAALGDQRDGGDAAGQPGDLDDVGQNADLRVLTVLGGHQQHALVVADIDRQGDVHIWEDDCVFQRE